jgi:hypothetical protein
MSKVAIEGNASGTGTFTIAAPNTNSNFTLSLPSETGTIVTTGTTTGISASAISTGTLAAARLPAGSVLQVINATYGVLQTTSSGTFTDTGLTATITPSSSSSKILVIVNQCGVRKDTGDTGVGLRLLRNSTVILKFEDSAGNTNSNAQNFIGSVSTSYLDSPATTSAVTYKTQFNSWIGIANARVQAFDGQTASTITLLEIAG